MSSPPVRSGLATSSVAHSHAALYELLLVILRVLLGPARTHTIIFIGRVMMMSVVMPLCVDLTVVGMRGLMVTLRTGCLDMLELLERPQVVEI